MGGCAEFGPGTAGVVESPGRTGAGVIMSGWVVFGVGTPGWSRLHAVNDNPATAMQVYTVKRFIVPPRLKYDKIQLRFFHRSAGIYVGEMRGAV